MIKLRTLDSVMLEVYDRITLNKPFDKKLKPYSKEKIKMALDFLKEKKTMKNVKSFMIS
jgi:hypothetical protein